MNSILLKHHQITPTSLSSSILSVENNNLVAMSQVNNYSLILAWELANSLANHNYLTQSNSNCSDPIKSLPNDKSSPNTYNLHEQFIKYAQHSWNPSNSSVSNSPNKSNLDYSPEMFGAASMTNYFHSNAHLFSSPSSDSSALSNSTPTAFHRALSQLTLLGLSSPNTTKQNDVFNFNAYSELQNKISNFKQNNYCLNNNNNIHKIDLNGDDQIDEVVEEADDNDDEVKNISSIECGKSSTETTLTKSVQKLLTSPPTTIPNTKINLTK